MTWEPIKPVAPVRNTRMGNLLIDQGHISASLNLLK
jgi:hypothetical protein